MKTRIHAFVAGWVQGVNFRYYTKLFAEKANLTGWVKNLDDGRVEVIAEGEKEDIDKLINYLHKGPIIARVKKVDVKEEKYKGEFNSFEIKY